MIGLRAQFERSMGWTMRHAARVALLPPVLIVIVALDVLGYVAGMTGWYGPVLQQPTTPVWAWPFIPDCPLFGLLGGLALVLIAARGWPAARRQGAQRVLAAVGLLALVAAVVYLAAWLPGDEAARRGLAALYALLGAALLIGGLALRRGALPAWLLTLIALGQIKYGIWTITAWAYWWRNTAALYGAPLVTAESVLMTIAHVALAAQGILLLACFRPTRAGALAALAWFALSDLVDYGPQAWGLGWHPGVPPILPLRSIRTSTVVVTWLLGLGLLAVAWPTPARRAARQSVPVSDSTLGVS